MGQRHVPSGVWRERILKQQTGVKRRETERKRKARQRHELPNAELQHERLGNHYRYSYIIHNSSNIYKKITRLKYTTQVSLYKIKANFYMHDILNVAAQPIQTLYLAQADAYKFLQDLTMLLIFTNQGKLWLPNQSKCFPQKCQIR